MKKYILALLFCPSFALALDTNNLTVTGRVITERMDVSTIGKVVVISFIDGSSQTTSGYVRGKDEGVFIMHTSSIDCVGSGITCTDAGSGVFRLSVPGGSGGEVFGYISTRNISMADLYAISRASSVETGRLLAESSSTLKGILISTSGALLGGSTVQGVFLVEGGTFQFRNGTNEFSITFASVPIAGQKIGVLNVTGSRALLGGVGDATGSGSASGEVFGYISTRPIDMNDFGIANSTGLELGNFLQLTTVLSTISVKIDELSISSTIIFNQESPDISNRTYYLHNESSGGLNSYHLILSSPSILAGTAKAKSIASADGLVIVSSHITLTDDPGVRKIPAGIWSFVSYVDVSNITGITQLVISVSTIGFGGNDETEIISSTSSDIDDLGQGTRIDQTAVQQNDVAMSTSDRISVRYFARTTNALGITFDFYYGGTSSAAHLNTPIGNVYKLTQLSDAPQTLFGQAGKFLAVNNDATATVFVSTPIDVISSTAANLADNTGTINTAGNPVHWQKLGGVPAGFADGVDDTSAGSGGAVFGYISSRNIDMNDFGIANSTGLELGNFLQVTTYMSTTTSDLNVLRSSLTFVRESTATFNTRFNTFSSTVQAEAGTFKGWLSTNSASIDVLISTLMAVRTDTGTFRSVFNTFTSTTQTHISTNSPTAMGRPAMVRASTGTSNGPSFVIWDSPHPKEFSWGGAALMAISTNNSPNVAPIIKTTGTKTSEVLGASYDDTLEECRGNNFRVPRYSDQFSTPTFTATWFSSSKSGATGNTVWNLKYSSGIMDGAGWDVTRTTATAPVSAGFANANRVSEISWQPSGVGGSAGNNGGISGHGTLSSMGWDAGRLVFFNVCREGPNSADDLVGDAILLNFTMSIPMR